MRYRELAEIEPQVGDILGIEIGDTLVEAVIQDLREDGVVIELDQQSVNLLHEAKRGTLRTPGFGDPSTILGRDDDNDDYYRQTQNIAQKMDPAKILSFDPGRQAFDQISKDIEKVTPIRPGISIRQQPAVEPEKAKPQPKADISLVECENALVWGIKIIQGFSSDLKSRLRNAGEGTTVEFLVLLAYRTNAFDRMNFTEQQLRSCEKYLDYMVNDASVKTWDDLIRRRTNETENKPHDERLKYDDYIRRASEIQARFQEAVRLGDKSLAAKIAQEREKLDTLARRGLLPEAEYQGRKVPLGKPMKGDVKKSKVYVRGPKGNVVKVNFGDPNMKIKKSNPKRRKSFRARHNCANPGPRWKARYWSCRAW